MILSEQEKERVQAMLLHFVKRKHELSGGHNGLSIVEFMTILRAEFLEMELKKLVKIRPSVNDDFYFLLKKP